MYSGTRFLRVPYQFSPPPKYPNSTSQFYEYFTPPTPVSVGRTMRRAFEPRGIHPSHDNWLTNSINSAPPSRRRNAFKRRVSKKEVRQVLLLLLTFAAPTTVKPVRSFPIPIANMHGGEQATQHQQTSKPLTAPLFSHPAAANTRTWTLTQK